MASSSCFPPPKPRSIETKISKMDSSLRCKSAGMLGYVPWLDYLLIHCFVLTILHMLLNKQVICVLKHFFLCACIEM